MVTKDIVPMQWMTDGLQLMVLGMGTVFLFLGIMVACIRGTAVLIRPFAHLLPDIAAGRTTQARNGLKGPVDDAAGPDVIAAVAAAVRRYRTDHGPTS